MRDPVRDRFVSVNGLRFHYRDWGDEASDPVVLLHGITGHARMWDGFARRLSIAGAWRVVVPDARGHGESEWAAAYGGAENISDLAALLDAIGLTSAVLIGFSMGGRTAYGYAASHPSRVEQLVIVDRGPETIPAATSNISARLDPAQSFADPEEAIALLRVANPRAPVANLRERALYNLITRPDGRWVWRYDPAMRARTPQDPPKEWALLPLITCPTLLIRGKHSDALARDVADRMVRAIRDCRYVEIDGAGHAVPIDQPEAFAQAALPFLKARQDQKRRHLLTSSGSQTNR